MGVTDEDGLPAARIGDPDVTLSPGAHRYELSFTTSLLAPTAPDGLEVLTWYAIGDGWRFGFEQVDLAARFATAPTGAVCERSDDLPCTAVVSGTTVAARTTTVPAHTSVSITASFSG